MKILLVDDDKKGWPFMRDAIEKLGHSIIGPAEDGVKALGLFEKEKPDLIFMDIDMPEMNGFDIMELILEVDPEARIVVITGLDVRPQEARDAGALGMLKKPLRMEKIRHLLEQVGAAFQKEPKIRRKQLTELLPDQ